MLNSDLNLLLKDKTSRYSLVTAAAKRARDISEESEKTGRVLVEKPVSLAVNDLLDGKYRIVEPEEIRNI
ncbi:MAG: DNA-directed RNA polymerase subunit omega [Oscillospiraceae bacterium]|nr:DNA-directed RNA polymerase subunit omega [Oscillospiraceae bacterium]